MEGAESERREAQDHDLRYRTGPIAELRRVSMCHVLHWSKPKQRLKEDPNYRCSRCLGSARPIDGRPRKEVQVGPEKLEALASFCYLEDMLSVAGGCELASTTRGKTAWKKFKELLPVLSSRHLSYKTHVVCTAHAFGTRLSMQARLGP